MAGTWSSGGGLGTARYGLAGCGTQSAGLSFGGHTGSNSNKTEEYNGTSWSAGGDLATATQGLAGCGSQTAGLSFGGYTGTASNKTEEYNVSISAPTVTTQSATDIATTSITGNGNITDTGGENCTRRGFCYKAGTSGDPTTSDSVAYDDGSFGTGAFTKSITGLTAGTSYRVRAYAVNSAGTSYGTTVDVKTLSAFIPRTMWF